MSVGDGIVRARPPVEVLVREHARERARERFPGFKAARIVDEVRDAICAMRLSAEKPPGLDGSAYERALYAWTPDGSRVYVLIPTPVAFDVVTTMRAVTAA